MNNSQDADERIDVHTNVDGFQNYLHWQRYNFVLDRIDSESDSIEIGTGLGVFSEMLIPKVGSYRGIEFDPEACLAAQKRISNPSLITRGDAQTMEFSSESFDSAVCLEVLEHLPDYRRALNEVSRVLRPGGTVFVSVPFRKVGGPSKVNIHHVYEPGEAELLRELEKRFSSTEVFYQRYEETRLQGFARRLHLRRILGLVGPYRNLTQGDKAELAKVQLDQTRQGMLLGVVCVCRL